MSEKPIIFNGPMVRAILEGRKTQTRRPMKPQPPIEAVSVLYAREPSLDGNDWKFFSEPMPQVKHAVTGWIKAPCRTGDHLWVRETWGVVGHPERTVYQANPADDYQWGSGKPSQGDFKWRPSIHMPRWASRITLEVTDVRVERVQEITEEDAEREGILFKVPRGGGCRRTFEAIWGEIYPGSWERNDWVWVIEFTRTAPKAACVKEE